MKDLLNKAKEAYELSKQLKEILRDMKSDMEYHDIGNLDEYISYEYTKETMIKSIHDHAYEFDINCENNITYEDEPEKRKAFYLGVNSGYNSAFFWFCEYLDLLKFFEDELYPIFEKNRLELIKDKS